jgi:hypothetical protein
VATAEADVLLRPANTEPDDDRAQHVPLTALLFRHRRVTVPILILAMLGAATAQLVAPHTYRAVGSIVLATPTQDPSRLPASIAQVSDAIAEMQRTDVRSGFLAADADFSATLLDRTTLVLTASADGPDVAEQTVLAAASWLGREITARQDDADIPLGDQLEGRLLTPTVVARRNAGSSYTAEAVVWIDGLGGAEENPYQASAVTSRLLTLWLTSVEGRAAVESRIGPDVSYLLVFDPWGPLPSIDIVTEGADAGEVIEAFHEIAAIMQLDLEGRQSRAQVPLARRIFVEELAEPLSVEDVGPALAPFAVVALLMGLASAGGAAALLDRRARQRTSSAAETAWPAT